MDYILYGIQIPESLCERKAYFITAGQATLSLVAGDKRYIGTILVRCEHGKMHTTSELHAIFQNTEHIQWHPKFNAYIGEKIRKHSDADQYVARPQIYLIENAAEITEPEVKRHEV